MPKPTIHRLLTDLVDAGFVDKLPWGRYQVGMRLFELGTLARGPATLRSLALPHLHSLYRDTGYTVYLTVTDQGHAVQIERSEEHTSELQSLMRISYAVFCLKKKKNKSNTLYKT